MAEPNSRETRPARTPAIVKTLVLTLFTIVTEVVPFKAFYKAEDYHQEYFKNNARQPYCQVVIAPKIVKLREHYREKLKTS